MTFEENGVKVIDFSPKFERLRCFRKSFFFRELQNWSLWQARPIAALFFVAQNEKFQRFISHEQSMAIKYGAIKAPELDRKLNSFLLEFFTTFSLSHINSFHFEFKATNTGYQMNDDGWAAKNAAW